MIDSSNDQTSLNLSEASVHTGRPLKPGDIVGGTYEVCRFLSEGGSGSVYLCRHHLIREQVFALKVFYYDGQDDEASYSNFKRFENEARLSIAINHPNVVSGFAFFREENYAALLMEYVGAGNLGEFIALGELLTIKEFVRLYREIISGVAAIHEVGVVHRDLKPENILVTKSAQVKVADFGISRTAEPERLTAHGSLLGTMDYLSPEYLMNGELDSRSDIYTLGLLGYELLLGFKPFSAATLVDALKAKLAGRVHSPSELRDDCPEELSRIILKAFDKDPNRRYQTALDILADLEALDVIIRREDNYQGGEVVGEDLEDFRELAEAELRQAKVLDAYKEQTVASVMREIFYPRTFTARFVTFTFFFTFFLTMYLVFR